MSIGSLVVDLVMRTGTFETDTKRASKQAEKFAKDIDRQISTAARAIAAAGAAAAVGLAAMVKSSIDSMDHLVDLREQLGLSTETLSELGYAAKLSGSDLDELVKGLNVLAKNAATAARGSGAAADAFSAIGVSVKNADGSLKSTDQLLSDVADAFSKYEDGAGKAAVAQEIFGKSGVSLIPFLNQGSAGIKELREEADKFGATIRDDAADAAAKFNDNLDKLHAGFTGIGNQIAQKVLPALTAITDRFVDAAKDGNALNNTVDEIVTGLKLLASAGIVIKTVFEAVGKSIGLVVAAISTLDFKSVDFSSPQALLLGMARNIKNVSQTASVLKEGFADIGSSAKSNIETLNSIWDEPKEKVEEVTVSVTKLKESLKFDDGSAEKAAEAIAKAAESALAKITEMTLGLQQQVDTFEQGETAVIRYRIANGDLAQTFKEAGKDAEPYKQQLIGLTRQLELMQDASEGAADAIAEFTEQNRQALEENIAGMFSDLDAQLKEVAAGSAFEEQFKDASFDTIRTGIRGAITGGAKEGWEGFRDAALNALADIVATDFTKRLLDWVTSAVATASASGGGGGGSNTGGWIAAIASIFGGARATGGPVDGGMLYRVNEREPEFFKPSVGGKVIPLSKMGGSMGGMSITNNISVEAPNGRISMETQQQLLARMSQALMSAQRRNG